MKIDIENPHSTKYPTIPIGTFVKCEKGVYFLDGTCHVPGDTFEVTEETQAYFSIFTAIGEYSVI